LDKVIGPSSSRAEEILSVAADLFWAKGYDATTMSDLSSALGITKASLYHHIDNKESLLFALSIQSLDRILEEAKAAANSAAPADRLETLRRVIHAHLIHALSDRNRHARILTEVRALSPEHRAEVTRRRDQYDRFIDDLLAAAQGTGQLRDDVSSRLLRLTLLNMLNWTIFWFSSENDGLTPSQLADVFCTLFIEGAAGTAYKSRDPRRPSAEVTPPPAVAK
jgi:AcrR family transcriptional regulator